MYIFKTLTTFPKRTPSWYIDFKHYSLQSGFFIKSRCSFEPELTVTLIILFFSGKTYESKSYPFMETLPTLRAILFMERFSALRVIILFMEELPTLRIIEHVQNKVFLPHLFNLRVQFFTP